MTVLFWYQNAIIIVQVLENKRRFWEEIEEDYEKKSTFERTKTKIMDCRNWNFGCPGGIVSCSRSVLSEPLYAKNLYEWHFDWKS